MREAPNKIISSKSNNLEISGPIRRETRRRFESSSPAILADEEAVDAKGS